MSRKLDKRALVLLPVVNDGSCLLDGLERVVEGCEFAIERHFLLFSSKPDEFEFFGEDGVVAGEHSDVSASEHESNRASLLLLGGSLERELSVGDLFLPESDFLVANAFLNLGDVVVLKLLLPDA